MWTHQVVSTFAIINQKSNAGKTTLVLHLAAAAHDAGRVALVLDTDPQATVSECRLVPERATKVVDSGHATANFQGLPPCPA
ncbi:AAA family ATPase [Sphingomonas sp. R86520]|uniref:nucleotide-binding protein n=1 Tax=Sphingomonas sp. R86520 TaxID=3093859 RepID=UPI0036D3CD34